MVWFLSSEHYAVILSFFAQVPSLLHPLLNQTNCAGKSAGEGRGAPV
jgi:hypothetical protein